MAKQIKAVYPMHMHKHRACGMAMALFVLVYGLLWLGETQGWITTGIPFGLPLFFVLFAICMMLKIALMSKCC